MLAPILAFTADEAWEFVPGKNVNSVHESEFKPGNFELNKVESDEWQVLIKLRNEKLQQELEHHRKLKNIGKSLDAKIVITCFDDKDAEILKKNAEALRELTNVSQLLIGKQPARLLGSSPPAIETSHADGQKCERCWHWEMDIGKNLEHPTICGRCVEAVMKFKA